MDTDVDTSARDRLELAEPSAPESTPGLARDRAPGRWLDGWERLGRTLSQVNDLEELFRRLCRDIGEGFGFSRVLLATVEPTTAQLVARAGYEPGIVAAVYAALRRLYRVSLQPDESGRVSAAAWCVLQQEQVHVPDARAYSFRPDRTYQVSLLTRAFGTEEYVLTPLVHRDRSVGMLAVDKRGTGLPIEQAERRLLRAVASVVGSALGSRLPASSANRPAPPLQTAMLVHDLRAPLQSVAGFAELLLMGRVGSLNDEQKEFVRRIEEAGGRMLELVEEILIARRLGTEAPRIESVPVPVAPLVEEVLAGLAGKAIPNGVKLIHELAPHLPPLAGDRRRLLELLQNLVDNAIDACEAGGTVRVEGQRERRADGQFLRLQVVDDGIGLDTRIAGRLLDGLSSLPSEPIADASRGLGLRIARLIAEAHGGELHVRGELGRGTTATVLVPVSTPVSAGEGS